MQLVVHPGSQTYSLQELLGIVAVHLAAQHHGHFHILQGGQIRQQVASVVLPDKTNSAAFVLHQLLVGNLQQIPFTHPYLACRGAVQTAQDVEKR
ncbi:hypothetical protein D3C81_2069820 [compost metagenome]